MRILHNRHIAKGIESKYFRKKQLYTLFFLQVFMFAPVFGQQNPLKFSYLTVDDGLSHTDAKDVLQDKLGFIWIATLFGLDRFDGHVIKRFYNTTIPKNYAFKNRIRSMCLDDRDRIWLGSEDGIQYFDLRKEQYVNMEGLHHRIGKRNYVRLIYLKNGYLATLGENRFRLYKINGKQLSEVALDNSLDVNFTDMTVDNSGVIWIASNNGVWQLDNFRKLKRFSGPGESISSPLNLLKIAINKKKQLILVEGTSVILSSIHVGLRGASQPVESDARTKVVSLPGCSVINDIIQDKNANYWVSSDAGLYLLDGFLNVKQIITNKSFVNSINTNFLNNLFIDRSECLWVCTFGGGIDYCDLNQKHFYSFQHNPENSNTLSGNHIRSIIEEAGKFLWVGTNSNGLNRYDFSTRDFKKFNNEGPSPKLVSNEVDALELDDDHNLWIGSDKGIEVMNSDRSGILHSSGTAEFPRHSIASLAKDRFGHIWFGSYYNGFGVITKAKTGAYNVSYKGTGSGYYIYADNTKPEVYVSSINGLIRLIIDSAGNVLQRFHYGVNNNKNSLSSDYIFPVRRSSPDSYWVGTIGGGLNRLKLGPANTYSVDVFDHAFGVFNDVEAIEIDDHGNAWMGGNGLECFDPVLKKLIRYDKNDGLQGNSFKVGASFRGKDGRLYFGGINGVNYFYPDSIKNNTIAAHPTFTDLVVNNQVIINNDAGHSREGYLAVPYRNELEFNYKQNNFVVSFSAMHYANSAKCKYRYKLQGFDKDWNYTSGERPSASYSNLDYNDYELLLEASNNDGVWSKDRAVMKIAILAPWWKNGIAKFVYLAIFISVLAGIYIYQARWYRLKNELTVRGIEENKREEMHLQREELYRQQLQFFANISHEFRTPLTLILGPLESLIAETNEKAQVSRFQIMYRNAKRLINLINELINFRKVADNVLELRITNVPVNKFVRNLYEEFRELANANQIVFSLEPPQGIIDATFDEQVVEKIMFNLLNNAFKYTPQGGSVTLQTFADPTLISPAFLPEYKYASKERADSYIFFRVSDTGVGISNESIAHIFDRYYRVNNNHIGSGIGLALVKSLIELHHGDIWVYSERNKGTEIYVAFPKDGSYYTSAGIGGTSGTNNAVQMERLDISVERNFTDLGAKPGTNEIVSNFAIDRHILIVEDNDELRAFLRQVLEKRFTVYEAANGEQGLEIALDKYPDLIISDVMMPVMNGVEFCRRIRSAFETSHIPFLFLSAKDALEAQLEGMESGADFYISKPVSIDLLMLTVNNLFEQNRKLKEKYTGDYYAEATELAHSAKDREFIEKLITLIEANIADPDMDVDFICSQVYTSRSALYKKIKAISGQSINEFIRTIRLKRAAYILTHEDITQNELVDRIGIQSVSYFQKAFKKEFGTTPTQFIQSLNK